jgi:hypothetical protein
LSENDGKRRRKGQNREVHWHKFRVLENAD